MSSPVGLASRESAALPASHPRRIRDRGPADSRAQAFNLDRSRITRHTLAGIDVDIIDLRAHQGKAWHKISSFHPILSAVIDEEGGYCEARYDISDCGTQVSVDKRGCRGHLSLIPADRTVWGYSDSISRVLEARFELQQSRLEAIFAEDFDYRILERPKLMVRDRKLQSLAGLLARECGSESYSPLFADHIMTSLLACLSRIHGEQAVEGGSSGLARSQLQLVLDYMRQNVAENIRLSELARMTGLSQSQFGRSFKSSTGISPHQWHMNERLERAKQLLREKHLPLVEIALATGFSEQSHFTRAFSAQMGVPPGAWRREVLH